MRTIAFGLSLCIIFAIPWENVVNIPGLGTASKGIGILAAVIWLVNIPLSRQLRKPHPFHLLCLLFVLWQMVSVLWSANFQETVLRTQTYVQLFVLIFLLWDLYTTSAAVNAGLQAYVLGAYVSVGSTIQSSLSGTVNSHYYDRYAAGLFDPNDLGLTLSLGIPLAWHLAISPDSPLKILRFVNFFYPPAAILAILLTASRTSLLTTFPAFLFIFWSLRKLKIQYQLTLLMLIIVSLVALQPLIPESSLNRVSSTQEEASAGDFNGRLPIWQQGLIVYLDHPMLGVGGSAYNSVIEIGKVAHNTFISVLVEVGIIGFTLFMAMLAMVVYQASRQPKLANMWFTALFIWCMGVSTLSWEHRKPTWLFFSLPVISAAASDRRSPKRAKFEGDHRNNIQLLSAEGIKSRSRS